MWRQQKHSPSKTKAIELTISVLMTRCENPTKIIIDSPTILPMQPIAGANTLQLIGESFNFEGETFDINDRESPSSAVDERKMTVAQTQ
jgi:hypothetical protein